MNVRRWLSAVASLVLVVGACGDAEEARVFTSDELGSALLTPADVGDGYVESQLEVVDERPEGMPPLDPGMWCEAAGNAADELLAAAGGAGAFVEITSADRAVDSSIEPTERSYHGVSQQLWSSTDAAAFVDRATTAMQACVGKTWIVDEADDADSATANVAELTGDAVGDDSTMSLVTYVTPAPDGDYAWRGRTLVARVGSTVMVVQELDVQRVGSEPLFTDAEWQRLIETAAANVEALAG